MKVNISIEMFSCETNQSCWKAWSLFSGACIFSVARYQKKKKEKKRKEKDRFRLFKPFLTATENDFCLLCVLASLKLQTVIIFCDLPVFNETINLKSEAQMVDSNGSLDNLFWTAGSHWKKAFHAFVYF